MSPAVATVTGRIVIRTYPGPPGYESIARGDTAERQLILILEREICAEGPGLWGDKDSPVRVDNVTEITLVPTDAVPRIRPIGAVFTVSGEMVEAHTAHHRTPLVLELRTATRLSNKRFERSREG